MRGILAPYCVSGVRIRWMMLPCTFCVGAASMPPRAQPICAPKGPKADPTTAPAAATTNCATSADPVNRVGGDELHQPTEANPRLDDPSLAAPFGLSRTERMHHRKLSFVGMVNHDAEVLRRTVLPPDQYG